MGALGGLPAPPLRKMGLQEEGILDFLGKLPSNGLKVDQ